jgi:hypothetical protein
LPNSNFINQEFSVKNQGLSRSFFSGKSERKAGLFQKTRRKAGDFFEIMFNKKVPDIFSLEKQ